MRGVATTAIFVCTRLARVALGTGTDAVAGRRCSLTLIEPVWLCGDSAGGGWLGTRAGIAIAVDTAGVLLAVAADVVIGGGTGVLDVVSGVTPVSTPCGSALETVPVALVTVSGADTGAKVERRARAVQPALELVVAAGPYLDRLIP